jgi:hypothetical protein
VKQYLEEINRELFEPRGMYMKTQSSSVHIDDYNETIWWITIALDSEEAEILKKEENLLYYWCCTGQHEPAPCVTRTYECLFCCCQKQMY